MTELEPGVAITDAVAVFDVDTPAFCENRLLDPEYAAMFPGAGAFAAVALRLRQLGIPSMTADVFLANQPRPARVACISLEQSRYSERLLGCEGVVGSVCVSLESPIMSLDFYRNLQGVTDRYRHSFLWPGTASRVSSRSTFHAVSWPYPDLTPPADSVPWDDRRFLALVSSNKRAFCWPSPLFDARHPRSSMRSLGVAMNREILRLRDPWFRSEIYLERQRAIEHFSSSSDFDLYGRGWDQALATLPRRTAKAVATCYRGEIPPLDKTLTLSGYRFALCYENTAFPGYITEKILDGFAAGCIPVYLGAPDVAEAIPAGSFINAAKFASLNELENVLRGMSNATADDYLASARDFLLSPAAVRFAEASFVAEVSQAVVTSLRAECEQRTRP